MWITPYAKEWRKQYMQRVREIAATGHGRDLCGYSLLDDALRRLGDELGEFRRLHRCGFQGKDRTGRKKGFEVRRFPATPISVNGSIFAFETMTDFVKEIRENARSVNPNIMVIPEIYPGIEEEATRVGADVYQMYNVIDVIAHEYEFGNGEHMAAMRSQVDWFLYQAGMLTFRAFAKAKASWILNYSWDQQKDSHSARANEESGEFHHHDRMQFLGCAWGTRWPDPTICRHEEKFSNGLKRTKTNSFLREHHFTL